MVDGGGLTHLADAVHAELAAPRSVVGMPSLADMMGPMVEPHGESFFTTKSCTETVVTERTHRVSICVVGPQMNCKRCFGVIWSILTFHFDVFANTLMCKFTK